MQVIIDLCVVPVGVGTSLSRYIAACQAVLDEAGLSYQLHAYGTNIEGDWDDVFRAVKSCYVRLHELGAPRITSTIKAGTRTDRAQTMADKVRAVQQRVSQGEDR